MEVIVTTNNEKLALQLMAKDVTKRRIQQWAKENNHPVRIKGVGSGDDFLINLSSSTGWISPRDWLFNYRKSCAQAYLKEKQRLERILPEQDFKELTATASDRKLEWDQKKTQAFTEISRALYDYQDDCREGKADLWKFLKRMCDVLYEAVPNGFHTYDRLLAAYNLNKSKRVKK